MNNTIKTWIQTNKGAYGYFIVQVWHDTETGEYETDRVSDSMEQYQFPTEREAIRDFEKGNRDEYKSINRSWEVKEGCYRW